ncbi:SDR family oxidoreductase [Paralimibaculum aggregatum]|uniref:SDR family oxidoreductase n=1 Tax=Paralimibaculum aggregatum TaxID=3036245 RepID=A0ABQ6LRT4_9RHOB|nr:SDR family oxidoreductase [Limibaculum sp. NKW23]GMG84359.1 SDR family oxidoreductase [Limibaculum sp. NKW23]
MPLPPADSPVLILGARSDIARALAHEYAAAGHPLMLAARDPATLAADCADLALRHGVTATAHAYDALDLGAIAAFFEALPATPRVVIQAVGYLGEQARAEADPQEAAHVVAANLIGPAAALEEAARRLAAAGGGTIIGLSSVAGERGRAKNHWYGAAKAGLTAVLSGLRQRWWREGVQVLTVKPGFVATRMTEGMDLPAPLTDSAAGLARHVKRAADRGRAVYMPWKWRLVMGVICALPETVFKRLSF